MTRVTEPGSRRVLIGLKVTEDMAARIDIARGPLTRADWLRGAADTALCAARAGEDWERRARDAERRLGLAAEAIGTPVQPSDEGITGLFWDNLGSGGRG
jgi:hypothetical protein